MKRTEFKTDMKIDPIVKKRNRKQAKEETRWMENIWNRYITGETNFTPAEKEELQSLKFCDKMLYG